MFGGFKESLEKQKSIMSDKLKSTSIEIEKEGIVISGNASKEINNISISDELFAESSKEMLEDLFTIVFNQFISEVHKIEEESTREMIAQIMPPGINDLFK